MRAPRTRQIAERKGTDSSSLPAGGGELSVGRLPAARGGVDYRALRDGVTIAQVLEILAWKPVAQAGSQLRGTCPIHKSSSERSRSFSVNVETNVFQCFGCGGKGNQLDLYVAVTGLPIYEAALDLARRLDIDCARNKNK